MKVVSGISDYAAKKTANGIQCLAAQIVARFKRGTRKTKNLPAQSGIGRFYLVPIDNEPEEFTYTVTVKPLNNVSSEIRVRIQHTTVADEKTPKEWLAKIKSEKT